jgi:hypothetical protein
MTRWAFLMLFAVGCSEADDGPRPRPLGAAYGNGTWTLLLDDGVTSGVNALVMQTSTDAVTWTETARFERIGADAGGIAFQDGRFVAAAGPLTLVSDDGTTWTVEDSLEMPTSIAGGRGSYVVTRGTGEVLVSDDGTEWSPATTDLTNVDLGWPRVTYAGDRFFVHGNGSAAIIESVDGLAWTQTETEIETELTSVLSVGTIAGELRAYGEWDCCGNEAPDLIIAYELRHQTDGSWATAEIDLANGFRTFVETPARIVAARDQLVTSSDGGVTWQPADVSGLTAPLVYPRQLIWNGADTLLVVGYPNLAISHDGGLTWTN